MIADSSHIITFCISISVIIYGSFRSLNLDQNYYSLNNDLDRENRDNIKTSNAENKSDDEYDEDNEYSFFINDDFTGQSSNGKNQSIQTIDSIQALFIPFIASISLLLMFFFSTQFKLYLCYLPQVIFF